MDACLATGRTAWSIPLGASVFRLMPLTLVRHGVEVCVRAGCRKEKRLLAALGKADSLRWAVFIIARSQSVTRCPRHCLPIRPRLVRRSPFARDAWGVL